MRRVVIESPYAGEVALNVAYAKRCFLDSLRRGEAPYASHLLFTQEGLLDDLVAEERALGIAAGLAWGAAGELVAVYVDRGISSGMRQGVLAHRRRGIEIVCRSFETYGLIKDARSFDRHPLEVGLCTCVHDCPCSDEGHEAHEDRVVLDGCVLHDPKLSVEKS